MMHTYNNLEALRYGVSNPNTFSIKSDQPLDTDKKIQKVLAAWTEMQICMDQAHNRNMKFNEYSLQGGKRVKLSQVLSEGETYRYFEYMERFVQARQDFANVAKEFGICSIQLIGDYQQGCGSVQ